MGFPPKSDNDRILLQEGKRLNHVEIELKPGIKLYIFHTSVAAPHTNLGIDYETWSSFYNEHKSREQTATPLIISGKDSSNHPTFIPAQFISWVLLEIKRQLYPIDIYKLSQLTQEGRLPLDIQERAGLTEAEISIPSEKIEKIWSALTNIEEVNLKILESLRQWLINQLADSFPQLNKNEIEKFFIVRKYAVMGRSKEKGEEYLLGTGAQTVPTFHAHTTLVFRFWLIDDSKILKDIINFLIRKGYWKGQLNFMDKREIILSFIKKSLANNKKEVIKQIQAYLDSLSSLDQLTLEGVQKAIQEAKSDISTDEALTIALRAFEPFYKNTDPFANRLSKNIILPGLRLFLTTYLEGKESIQLIESQENKNRKHQRFFINQGLRVNLVKPLPIGEVYQLISPVLSLYYQIWERVYLNYQQAHSTNTSSRDFIQTTIAELEKILEFKENPELKTILESSLDLYKILRRIFHLTPSIRQVTSNEALLQKKEKLLQILNDPNSSFARKVSAALEIQSLGERYYLGYPLPPTPSLFISFKNNSDGLVTAFLIGPSLSKRSGAEILQGSYILRDRPDK